MSAILRWLATIMIALLAWLPTAAWASPKRPADKKHAIKQRVATRQKPAPPKKNAGSIKVQRKRPRQNGPMNGYTVYSYNDYKPQPSPPPSELDKARAEIRRLRTINGAQSAFIEGMRDVVDGDLSYFSKIRFGPLDEKRQISATEHLLLQLQFGQSAAVRARAFSTLDEDLQQIDRQAKRGDFLWGDLIPLDEKVPIGIVWPSPPRSLGKPDRGAK